MVSTDPVQQRQQDCGTTTGDVIVHSTIGDPASTTDPLTERNLRIWSAGAYDRIAAGFRHEAEAFVERQRLGPDMQVLDAACGSGNLTIPAARTGARVTGFDLVPALLELATEWAASEGLGIRLGHGTVEALPFHMGEFDVVLSMFGVMFATRPDRVVAELARVTRIGGRVVLANWTRSGFIGLLLATHAGYVPPPPGVPSPLLWGDASFIAELFDPTIWEVTCTPRMLTFRYPHSPAGTAELFRTAYGPTVRTFEALDEDRRVAFARDLAALWSRNHADGAQMTIVDSEYLEVVAKRL